MGRQLACRRTEVPENGLKECDLPGGSKVLIANSGDEYFACQAICPHQEVALAEGLYDGSVLTCHQHLWQWDIRTGEARGLAELPLELYKVSVEGDNVYIEEPGGVDLGELFSGLSDSTLAQVSGLARAEEITTGGKLYSVGDPADDFFVLQSGRIEFLIGREDRTTPAGFAVRKGEVCGWAALLEGQPRRIAQATCLEPSTVLRINGRETLRVLETDPAAGYLVMRRLASLITRYLAPAGAK